MKKTVSLILICVLAIGVLASCDSKETSLVKQINEAYESGTPMTYEEVRSNLPLGALWIGYDSESGKNGVFCLVEGISSREAYDARIDSIIAGASYKGIIVKIINNKAVKAAGDKLDNAAYQELRKN